MKKRILSLALALVMLCTVTMPSLAAQSADERLAAVTSKVKATLGLDTEKYTEFYGDLNEEVPASLWSLSWSGGDDYLTVTATEEGKVLDLYRSGGSSSGKPGGVFAPSFPEGSRETARKAAQAFLAKVLTAGETVELTDSGADRLGLTYYRFSGKLLLNGLPAGMNCSISVRCSDNEIVSFHRDDLSTVGVMGGIPGAVPKTAAADAAKSLRSTLSMKLEYVLDESGAKAVLRYLPVYGDTYYVDALTGELVNLSELYRAADKGLGSSTGGSANGSASDAAAPEEAPVPAPGLTDAELGGAALLEGVLSKEELDKKAAAIKALGLSSYTLSAVNYTVSRDDDEKVTATLRYGKQVNGASWRRTVVVDAKTGELIRVYSSAWMQEEGSVKRPVDFAAAQKNAEKFLKEQCPAMLAKTELTFGSDALSSKWSVSHSFTYTQKANGYFFPGNTLQVEVDATDGSVAGYWNDFDESVTFDSADGLIGMDKAVDAWLGTYDVQLKYVQVPSAVDYSDPVYAPLESWGIRYLHRLVLGYSLERDTWYAGIDAKTGRPVGQTAASNGALTYSDISGHWAEKYLLELARYSVGYGGGACRPNDPVTQRDMVALLASAVGYRYDPANDDADYLYQFAYNYGIIDPADRSDDLVLTRLGAAKLLVDALGYGRVAKLRGIYKTTFTDDASIPAADYGYAALAQGLGILNGQGGACRPLAAATRAQAAVMLYNVMSREMP